MADTPIICHGCGATGSVGRVTASLICATCNTGDNLDIWEGTPKTAAPHGPGTGWNETRPNTLENWDEYQGPAVDPNPLVGERLDGTADAYSGDNYKRGNPDYSPGGGYEKSTVPVGPITGVPPIESWDSNPGPSSGGARWQGKQSSITTPLRISLPNGRVWEGEGGIVVSAGRTSGDPMGSVEQYNGDYSDHRGPAQKPNHPANHTLSLNTPCPSCGNGSTHIRRDKNDDGWWGCPKCGPLANIDKNPSINPLSPPDDFTPDRRMKVKAGLLPVKKTGQLLKMSEVIKKNNSGLGDEEILDLSRKALLKWGNN